VGELHMLAWGGVPCWQRCLPSLILLVFGDTHTQVGRPYALDPRSLDTLGESDMGGQISQRLAGHYRTVPGPDGSQRCVVFGTQVRGRPVPYWLVRKTVKACKQTRLVCCIRPCPLAHTLSR
jgi:carotenoid cleavage dioxygenase-like enzyme